MEHKKRIAALILVICSLFIVLQAYADEDTYFIICNPKSYVVVRRSPKKGAEEVGRLDCGDSFETDEKKKNGFMHVYGVGEYGEGWVFAGYVVHDEPVIEEKCYGSIDASGRVMTRRYIGGKRTGWLDVCTELKIYARSEEWAVTSRGFIRMMYLEVWHE